MKLAVVPMHPKQPRDKHSAVDKCVLLRTWFMTHPSFNGSSSERPVLSITPEGDYAQLGPESSRLSLPARWLTMETPAKELLTTRHPGARELHRAQRVASSPRPVTR